MTAIFVVTSLAYLVWALNKGYSKYVGYLAWLLHAVICFNLVFDENGWKLYLSNAVLLVAWLSIFIVFIFKLESIWVKIPLVFFVITALLLNYLNPVLEYQNYTGFSWQLDLHISLSMFSYALLTVSSLYAISLYTQIVKIKNTNFTTNNSLLSLIDAEKKLFHLIFIGWLVLSTSLLSGVIFIENFSNQNIGHKVVFSLLAWLLFGAIILGRIIKGWRGEKLIILTIVAMTLLATGYLGSKIIMEWIL
ncbi:MAG: cytochrome c biogenesis protein CcsA [Proteobacteria bacterium]|nr:cytochrome c biogenesis protein CcsA [Pseudomonadota bacterium]